MKDAAVFLQHLRDSIARIEAYTAMGGALMAWIDDRARTVEIVRPAVLVSLRYLVGQRR